MKVFCTAFSTLISFILCSWIVLGRPIEQGLETTFRNNVIPIETGASPVTGEKSILVDGDGQQESAIAREAKLFSKLKEYVDGDKFYYEKYLRDFYKVQKDWHILAICDRQSYVANVFKAMTKAAEEIVSLFNHDNQGVASVIRNMYQFYISLLFSYKADRTVDGDVSSNAYREKNLELWDKYKQVRKLPRGLLWDLRKENVELNDKIYDLLDDLRSKIPL